MFVCIFCFDLFWLYMMGNYRFCFGLFVDCVVGVLLVVALVSARLYLFTLLTYIPWCCALYVAYLGCFIVSLRAFACWVDSLFDLCFGLTALLTVALRVCRCFSC